MRGLHGRFGLDHSEYLNYEIEQTNKQRDQHMNWLVYKDDQVGNETEGLTMSEVLQKRLKVKPEELDFRL